MGTADLLRPFKGRKGRLEHLGDLAGSDDPAALAAADTAARESSLGTSVASATPAESADGPATANPAPPAPRKKSAPKLPQPAPAPTVAATEPEPQPRPRRRS